MTLEITPRAKRDIDSIIEKALDSVCDKLYEVADSQGIGDKEMINNIATRWGCELADAYEEWIVG